MRPVTDRLYRPMEPLAVALTGVALIAATALYCIAYNLLMGSRESLGEAMLWAVVNILPWFLAFEAAKRGPALRSALIALAAALASSMLLHVLVYGAPTAPAFELVRRIPALLLVAALLAGPHVPALRSRRGEAQPLPLRPQDVDWVSAAGNYVELRASGRTVLHRAPISHVERALEKHGFVRIHRSTLVRRDRIARVRPNDVVLDDGTSLKTGKRYRSTLH
jgi:hypothetical protein